VNSGTADGPIEYRVFTLHEVSKLCQAVTSLTTHNAMAFSRFTACSRNFIQNSSCGTSHHHCQHHVLVYVADQCDLVCLISCFCICVGSD
jgi:hypothetical protein